MQAISQSDRQILREVAKKQLSYAMMPEMATLRDTWIRHNRCEAERPMIVIEWGSFPQETIPPLLRCEGDIAREVEWAIYSNFVGQMLFSDDSYVDAFMPVRHATWFTPFGLDVQVDHPESGDSVGHHFHEYITDLGDDFHKLGKSQFGVDRKAAEAKIALYEDIFGDILPTRMVGSSLYSVPTQNLVHIMSMETMLYSLYDYPELFHKMMQQLTDDYLAYFRFMEAEGLLLPTIGNEPVGNGTFAFTDALPDGSSGAKIRTQDIWGFLDSQETTGISPDMYHEFIYPYYKQIADVYGMLSYGCCEAVDPIWEKSLSQLSTLRKVSISPWCNEEYMGDVLSGTNIIYHRKPSPNFIGVDKVLDVDGLKAHFRRTLDATKGCTVEFTQRDVYTVHGDMEKVRTYVQILRQMTA